MADVEDALGTWTEEELRDKVGQLFIVGFHGHTPSENIKYLIAVHKVGAIILFQRNIRDASQLHKLTTSLQALAKEAGYTQDLFIGIDQENGLVTRIQEPIAAQLPGAMTLAATGDVENAYRIASATAETLRTFGINFNYAPIADVNSEPKNPIIGVRSPSDDPEMVGRFVSAQVKGLKENGVIVCVKHFPGHGNTKVDSHIGLPVIEKTRAQLNACELIPFRRTVIVGVDAVMTAHIALPNLVESRSDQSRELKDLPGSLNPEVIKILREDMKYDGLIITDCLEMDGVRATYGTEKSAVMALKAGVDCVMICHTGEVQINAIELVVEAVKSGKINRNAIAKSVQRVERLKRKIGATSASIAGNWEDVIARQQILASEVYAKSTTVVRHEPQSFPISSKDTDVVFISPEEWSGGGGIVTSGEAVSDVHRPSTYLDLLHTQNPNITGIQFTEGKPLSAEAEKFISAAETVILATRNANLSSYQKNLGLTLGEKLRDKLIVIATADPYDFLEERAKIKNYIAIYEPTMPAFKAAVDVLFGVRPAVGTLPVGKQPHIDGIRSYSGSEEDSRQIWDLWQRVFPSWKIVYERLTRILQQPTGIHLIHENGFAIAYNSEGTAKIVAVGVLPDIRRKGLGTALIAKITLELQDFHPVKSLGIGSSFPRFWAGVPMDFAQEYKDWVAHRGFRKSTRPTSRDLWRDIKVDVAPPAVMERVSKLPLNFSPWSAELYEECMQKQRANFGDNQAWVNAYERLAAVNQHHEVMVAFDSETGAQIGWTLMCSPSSIICSEFAFLPLTPSRDKTGLIACVGVDKAGRGKGVGLALLVKAMENMRERGVEGMLIDWVVIRGFYENLGFSPIWEYEDYEW